MSDFHFRSLTIDLTSASFTEGIVKGDVLQMYLGGSALGAYLLYPELHNDLDPFASEAPLAFVMGPLTGTSGPAVGRFVICGRSPATGIWAESNIGGFFGTELRRAGIDILVIRGRATSPVYVWIENRRSPEDGPC